eukprot:CAMPEP_0177711582 /NCGR_PEP_ID=MMETSP0484_2-20121128/11937_1 /TAXON_ID=354590 /ORGANISM="Rhodomonas lens, Strain RHODO" /LENGTH=228 /DNA_ID=CAMNT_0019223323 /DNA_START=107 /DNA_END=793 /DNA_ORIENTATION=-
MSALPAAPVGPTALPSKIAERTPPPAGSQDVEPVSLGKRKASEDTWYPGMGLSSKNDQQKRTKQFKTSLLFLQLQAQVKSAIENKAKADAKERQISLEIAHRHPMVSPARIEIAAPATRKPVNDMDMDYISAKKKLAVREMEMPAPLSAQVLEAARKELPAGAVFSIDTCLKCWREKKMAWDEVLFTVKTFASSSATLKSALESTEQQHRGEQATMEQMRELSALACA